MQMLVTSLQCWKWQPAPDQYRTKFMAARAAPKAPAIASPSTSDPKLSPAIAATTSKSEKIEGATRHAPTSNARIARGSLDALPTSTPRALGSQSCKPSAQGSRREARRPAGVRSPPGQKQRSDARLHGLHAHMTLKCYAAKPLANKTPSPLTPPPTLKERAPPAGACQGQVAAAQIERIADRKPCERRAGFAPRYCQGPSFKSGMPSTMAIATWNATKW